MGFKLRLYSPPAHPQVEMKPIGFGEPFIGKNNHLLINTLNKVLETTTVVHIGSITVPIQNQSEMIQQQTAFVTHNPSLIE